jgi:hypothetical protein
VSLIPTGFIPSPLGADPGFDHADVSPASGRMYVAHTGADRIDVLDCAARIYHHALPTHRPGVAGVLIDEEHDLLFSSDRAAERVSVLRCSEHLLGQIEVGPYPNGLAYHRERRCLYSFNLGDPLGENCTASIVELDSMRLIAELPLPGRRRWAVYDEQRDFRMTSVEGLPHLRNLARDPRAAIWVDTEASEPVNGIRANRRVRAQGLAETGADDGVDLRLRPTADARFRHDRCPRRHRPCERGASGPPSNGVR